MVVAQKSKVALKKKVAAKKVAVKKKVFVPKKIVKPAVPTVSTSAYKKALELALDKPKPNLASIDLTPLALGT